MFDKSACTSEEQIVRLLVAQQRIAMVWSPMMELITSWEIFSVA